MNAVCLFKLLVLLFLLKAHEIGSTYGMNIFIAEGIFFLK